MRRIVLTCFILFSGCAHQLPSRPDTGNHGQGKSPDASCPHQHPMYVDIPDGSGTFFIYCWGVTT